LFRTHAVKLLPFVVAAALLGGCNINLGGNPSNPVNPPANPGAFPVPVAPPVPDTIGQEPKPEDQTPEAIEVPLSFPVLTEEASIRQYVMTMAEIHVAVTKSRQYHEVPPQVTAVTGAMSCPTVPGQTGKLRQVGDAAKNTKAGKAMVIAACYKGSKRSIFFAPSRMYQIRQTQNVQVLEDVIRVAMRDYLAGVTQDKAGNYDKLIVACSAGRMIGGLRDGNYYTVQRANALEVSSSDQSEYAKVYRNARDTGLCAPRLFGSQG